MVHAMAKDRGSLPRVAWLGILCACGPTVRPDQPFPEERGIVARTEREPKPVKLASGRQVVIGEMCPQVAAGRPAVAPLLARTTQWVDNAGEVSSTVERGATPRFVVFGVDGKVAGVFDTVGLADIAPQQSVASGTYAGGPPCTADAGRGQQRVEDPKCSAATGGCGLAVAEIARPDDPPPTPGFQTGGACLAGDTLAVDIDGDGAVEAFPLKGVLDGIRGPAQEWSAAPTAKPACTPKFTLYDIKLLPDADPGKQPDPRATVTLDVLGVVDVDNDGRKDLVLALRFPTVRTIVVYSGTSSAQRLDLVGEATSFQH